MIGYCLKSLVFSIRTTTLALLLLGTVLSGPVFSGTWRVIPIRLEFDQRARSGVVTLINDSEETISFKVEAREWTQDRAGKDQYTETSDILFFPQSLTLGPNSQRVIRAGIKVPALNREKTYRLFIQQEPPPQDKPTTAVAIVIRFGLPIFAKPLEEDIRGEIVRASIQGGDLSIGVKNKGNAHFRVKTLKISGNDANGAPVFSEELSGAYLLAGTERTFATALPEKLCSQMDVMTIEVVSDRIQLSGEIDVDRAMCLKP